MKIKTKKWISLSQMKKYKTSLEGHLDEAGSPVNKSAREILAELALIRTAAGVAQAVNMIIDPYEVNEQTVRVLMYRLKIKARPAGKGKLEKK